MQPSIRVCAIFLALAALAISASAEKKRTPLASVNFVVVKDENGKPIRNAAVVMHPVNEQGRQQKNGLELKTDSDGKAGYEGVPYGRLRIQVLAQGFQTYGEDYDIDQPLMDFTIKMKKPAGQYSIYEEHPQKPQEKKPE